MDKYWIVVSDAAIVKIFKAQKIGGEMEFIKKLENEGAHEKDSDMVSDKQGSHRWPQGGGSFESRSDPKEVEIFEFSAVVAKVLSKDHENKKFDKLVVVAPAKFMGDMRKEMRHALQQSVALELTKDYTHMTTKELEKHLQEHKP